MGFLRPNGQLVRITMFVTHMDQTGPLLGDLRDGYGGRTHVGSFDRSRAFPRNSLPPCNRIV